MKLLCYASNDDLYWAAALLAMTNTFRSQLTDGRDAESRTVFAGDYYGQLTLFTSPKTGLLGANCSVLLRQAAVHWRGFDALGGSQDKCALAILTWNDTRPLNDDAARQWREEFQLHRSIAGEPT